MISELLQLIGIRIGKGTQAAPDDAMIASIEAQQKAERDSHRRGKFWDRDGDRLVLSGYPLITIRRCTADEIANRMTGALFCVECPPLPPEFRVTLRLAKDRGEELAVELDELPLSGS